MAVMPILRWPDARLSSPCAPVRPGEDVATLAGAMLDTMYHAPGRGLAAPQVGVLKRLFVMDVTWKDATPTPIILINPEILSFSETRVTGIEGCLSLPGLAPEIERAAEITLRWTTLDGQTRTEVLPGFAAICAQHEYDHLDGIVTLDRLSPTDRAKAEAAYTT